MQTVLLIRESRKCTIHKLRAQTYCIYRLCTQCPVFRDR